MEREHQYLFLKKNVPEYIFFLAGGQEVVARVGGVGGGGGGERSVGGGDGKSILKNLYTFT